MQIQFIRHATLLLQYNNKKLLIDPMLSQKGTMSAIKNVPNKNNNPLVDLPISIACITNCDAVLITHIHRDHFDDEAVTLLPKEITIFCQPEDVMKIKKLGFQNVISICDSLEWEGIKITRKKGKHGHGVIAQAMGPVSGFIFSSAVEPCIYLSGDTIWYSYIDKILAKYNPQILICNCGEARFSCGRAITMNKNDILSIITKYPIMKIVAVHMEAWNHCRLSRKELRKFALQYNIDKQVFIPEDGELLDKLN